MNLTYLRLELTRSLRDAVGFFFIAVLPVMLYIIFGVTQEFGDEPAGPNGANVAMYIMVSMAVYGAVIATTTVGGGAAVERFQGWGRQLGLTRLRNASFVLHKAVVALMVAIVPIGLVYLAGVFTGAEAPAGVWALTAVLSLLGAAAFSIYGMIFGLLFRTESAVGAAAGMLVILAFLGNLFFPLSGVLLTIAKFTPLYGVATLARYPVTDGYNVSTTGELQYAPLWEALVNVGVWLAIFIAIASWAVTRGRGRQ